ncbi:hypothetical protein BEN78_16320 [Xanthomonas citri pv. mangiferaeindicae]|nr:hypothetical protein BEN78_16320 [Xanthomonas citri pv. mangiferaeindicae]
MLELFGNLFFLSSLQLRSLKKISDNAIARLYGLPKILFLFLKLLLRSLYLLRVVRLRASLKIASH